MVDNSEFLFSWFFSSELIKKQKSWEGEWFDVSYYCEAQVYKRGAGVREMRDLSQARERLAKLPARRFSPHDLARDPTRELPLAD